ncbi:hypothetical protein ACPV5O_05105 [Vibrio maritimus]|uniref:hypothetical protein n=1 Tax=Vibrio maritimus TaxID=990268 RepID=UPI0040689E90
MSYLPFYITPEEFEQCQHDRELELRTTGMIDKWKRCDSELAKPFISPVMALIPLIVLVPMHLWLATEIEMPIEALWLLSVNLLLTSLLSYTTLILAKRYEYNLFHTGLVIKRDPIIARSWLHILLWVVGVFSCGAVFIACTVAPLIISIAIANLLLCLLSLKNQSRLESDKCVIPRKSWLFARYNTKRKVVVLYHKGEFGRYVDKHQNRVFRYQGGKGSAIFCRSTEHLDSLVRQLSSRFELECHHVETQSLFGSARLEESGVNTLPRRYRFYLVSDAQSFRDQQLIAPAFRYGRAALLPEMVKP